MNKMIFMALAGTLVPTAALGQAAPAKERSAIMRMMQDDAYNPMRQMARGERPYDMNLVNKAYKTIGSGLARAPDLWPPNSPSDSKNRYASSSKVWENRADFEARLREAQKLIKESEQDAASGLAGLQGAVPRVEKACSNCHESYRIRQ